MSQVEYDSVMGAKEVALMAANYIAEMAMMGMCCCLVELVPVQSSVSNRAQFRKDCILLSRCHVCNLQER